MVSVSLGTIKPAIRFLNLLLATVVVAWADTELPNFVYVAAASTDGSSPRGDRFAKCVPSDLLGSTGATTIYLAKADGDVVLHSYRWYSPQIYLSVMKGKTSLARFWSWQAGSEANSNHIAFAFYRDGELIKKYSTLEIAGRSGNILASVSQYLWYRSV
jgi:hypothetical protein